VKENLKSVKLFDSAWRRRLARMEFTLLAVRRICEPLARQPIAMCMEKELADSSEGEDRMEIDVLIGSYYYWELTTGEMLRGENGPFAIHTKLGWVLSGTVQSPELPLSSVNLVVTHALQVDSQQCDTERLDDRL